MLKAGADPNARDAHDRPALHAAVKGGYLEVARMLLDAGADVNATRGRQKEPALEYVHEGRPDIINLLLDRGANAKGVMVTTGYPTNGPETKECLDCVQRLIKAGGVVNDENPNNPFSSFPLKFAELYDREELKTLLKKAGAK